MTDEEKVEFYKKHCENDERKVSCFALVCSFLIPIVGVVCYFAQRDRVDSPNGYLHAAFWGFIVNLILVLAEGA